MTEEKEIDGHGEVDPQRKRSSTRKRRDSVMQRTARMLRNLKLRTQSSAQLPIARNTAQTVSVRHPKAVSREKRLSLQHHPKHSMAQLLVPRDLNLTSGFRLKCVIFDKDGTLICFHKMWSPWAYGTAERVKAATASVIPPEVDIKEEIYDELGFCPIKKKCRPGLLAEGTMPQIKQKLTDILIGHGLERMQARKIIEETWRDSESSNPNNIQAIADLQHIFTALRHFGIKVAVCTADSRQGTDPVLKHLGVYDLVDYVVCSDDMGAQPKPRPDNAWRICHELGVQTHETAMVGDTLADLGMARNAHLAIAVGVMTGIATRQSLATLATHVVDHVGQTLPIMLQGYPTEDIDMTVKSYTS